MLPSSFVDVAVQNCGHPNPNCGQGLWCQSGWQTLNPVVDSDSNIDAVKLKKEVLVVHIGPWNSRKSFRYQQTK